MENRELGGAHMAGRLKPVHAIFLAKASESYNSNVNPNPNLKPTVQSEMANVTASDLRTSAV